MPSDSSTEKGPPISRWVLKTMTAPMSSCIVSRAAFRSTSAGPEADGQLLHRDVQRIAARRVPERALVRVARGRWGEDRRLADGLQRESDSPGSQRADAGRIRSTEQGLGDRNKTTKRRKLWLRSEKSKWLKCEENALITCPRKWGRTIPWFDIYWKRRDRIQYAVRRRECRRQSGCWWFLPVSSVSLQKWVARNHELPTSGLRTRGSHS